MQTRTYGIVNIPNVTVTITDTTKEVDEIFQDKPDLNDDGLNRILKARARKRLSVDGDVPNLYPV